MGVNHMKSILMSIMVVLGLSLSACGHFGHGSSCCKQKGSCSMESKDKADGSKCCSGGECEMKK